MGASSQRTLRTRADDRDFSFLPDEPTFKTKAAVNLVKAARAMGILDRVWLVLSQLYGNITGVAANSPRRVERRKDKWRGQEKGTVSLDLTGTDGSGESDSLDLMGDSMWSHFQRKAKRKKR
jgi:hypothetical protein